MILNIQKLFDSIKVRRVFTCFVSSFRKLNLTKLDLNPVCLFLKPYSTSPASTFFYERTFF